MKKVVKLAKPFTLLIALAVLSGCAAGAATAATSGYSLKAQTADSLSAEGEQRLVERTKKEIMAELSKSSHSVSNCQ